MPGTQRSRHRRSRSLVIGAIAVAGALLTAGLASAGARGVHVKVSKTTITISGSRSSTHQVVQISYDPNKCAAYPTESRRSVQYSDLRSTKTGAFKYLILRSKLHLAKPKPHYACVYLLNVSGSSITSLAASGAKMP
jgi:hypothetical protein